MTLWKFAPRVLHRTLRAGLRLWASLDAPAEERRVPGTLVVAFLTALIQIPVAIVSVSTGASLYYDDAASHLTIARRLFDSIHPGFQQLGTVWLPVPHLLLAPLTIPLSWWSSGTSGAILGGLCLVATACALYRVCARLGFHRAGRLGMLAALLVNPSVLYIFTTALTEPVLLAGIACATAGLARWAVSTRTPSGGELAIFAGIPTAAAVMSRYEGWAFLLSGCLLILILHRRRHGRWRDLWRPLTGFTAVPAAAIAWWLAYNWGVQHNPLAFMNGEYSASALQLPAVRAGMDPEAGNLGLSLTTYDWALLETVGFFVLGCAGLGLLLLLYREGLSSRNLVLGITLSTYVFSVLSLYLGKTIMWNVHTLPVDQWNARFAMSVMIPAVLCTGGAVELLSRRGWRMRSAVALLLVAGLSAQTLWWAAAPWERSAVMREAKGQVMSRFERRAVFVWLRQHYRGGRVLVDETSTAYGSLPTLGLPLKEVITRSTGSIFHNAVRNPEEYARWVVMQRSAFTQGAHGSASAQTDIVGRTLHSNTVFSERYRLVYQDSINVIYERF